MPPDLPPPVLEVFYSPSCAPCRLELPAVAEIAGEAGTRVRIIILDQEERTRGAARRVAATRCDRDLAVSHAAGRRAARRRQRARHPALCAQRHGRGRDLRQMVGRVDGGAGQEPARRLREPYFTSPFSILKNSACSPSLIRLSLPVTDTTLLLQAMGRLA